jgi:GNAT superfamily N-acetyltransferase
MIARACATHSNVVCAHAHSISWSNTCVNVKNAGFIVRIGRTNSCNTLAERGVLVLMATSSQSYTLRPAVADELELAVAIDDAAALLFAQAGMPLDMPNEHPFVLAERARWRRCLEAEQLLFACHAGEPIGFFALAHAGDRAYLEQLSVRPEHGRRGVGALLLSAAYARSRELGETELWLTTYAHLPWNKPYYERQGFEVIPEAQCNAALRALLEEQRAALPHPEQRVAMVRRLAA